jgi:hypothetical protein
MSQVNTGVTSKGEPSRNSHVKRKRVCPFFQVWQQVLRREGGDVCGLQTLAGGLDGEVLRQSGEQNTRNFFATF